MTLLGRPAPTEADSYYFIYINQILGDDPCELIAHQLDEALNFFSTIPEEQSAYRYAPEKWSIRQVLNHISDTERAFAFRALWFARGFDTALPSFDQNIAANGASADRVPWRDHVDEFSHVRLSTISLFRNLPRDCWMKSGVASGCTFTVRALAFIIPGHVAHHIHGIREHYLSTPLD
jgi:hypothetical protein